MAAELRLSGTAALGRSAQPVERALDPVAALVEHVRVDHRRAHVLMSQQFLHGTNVVRSGKRVEEREKGRESLLGSFFSQAARQ